MSWEGFCITCQRTIVLEEAPAESALPDCPVCSSPVVAVADELPAARAETEEVLWVIDTAAPLTP